MSSKSRPQEVTLYPRVEFTKLDTTTVSFPACTRKASGMFVRSNTGTMNVFMAIQRIKTVTKLITDPAFICKKKKCECKT